MTVRRSICFHEPSTDPSGMGQHVTAGRRRYLAAVTRERMAGDTAAVHEATQRRTCR